MTSNLEFSLGSQNYIRKHVEQCRGFAAYNLRDPVTVQAADSLLKLVSELKQTAIFSGFASLNDHVEQRIGEFNKLTEKTDVTLGRVGEEAAASLKELESHFYSSAEKACAASQPSSP